MEDAWNADAAGTGQAETRQDPPADGAPQAQEGQGAGGEPEEAQGAREAWDAPDRWEAQKTRDLQPESAPPAGQPQAGQDGRFAEQLRRYQQREMEAVFAGDLETIHRAYPDERARSVDELGPQFIAMCAAGVSPLSAYEALRTEKARRVKQPPSMGDVRPVGGKGFYTRDEVARMSRKEIERNFERIRRSMNRW